MNNKTFTLDELKKEVELALQYAYTIGYAENAKSFTYNKPETSHPSQAFKFYLESLQQKYS